MLQAILIKTIIGKVMDAIEKADDKKIARSLHKRIKALEKNSHPPQEYICCKKCGCKIAKTK
tara:strand:- start:537 stop:722 length:186 start_codon:yes stop_codon:yes gene_type:complete